MRAGILDIKPHRLLTVLAVSAVLVCSFTVEPSFAATENSVIAPKTVAQDAAPPQDAAVLSSESAQINAATSAAFTPAVAPQPVDQAGLATAGGIARWFGSTFAVLAIIFVCAYVLKKMRWGRVKSAQLQVESMLSLGPKEKVVLLKTHERELLLGVTSQSINLLCDLTAAAAAPNKAAPRLDDKCPDDPAPAAAVQDDAASAEAAQAAEFARMMADRLEVQKASAVGPTLMQDAASTASIAAAHPDINPEAAASIAAQTAGALPALDETAAVDGDATVAQRSAAVSSSPSTVLHGKAASLRRRRKIEREE